MDSLATQPASPFALPLRKSLGALIREGHLTVIEPNGAVVRYGKATEGVPNVEVRVSDRLTLIKLLIWPDLYFGEAYMSGALTLEQGSLWDLLHLCGHNIAKRRKQGRGFIERLISRVSRQLHQYNNAQVSRANVAHHYDLSYDLYRTFLDPDMQYSCAYFADETMTLEEAQAAKKRHIIAKLALEPGHRVLDIGCGWGGLALSIAKSEHVFVHGITLSQEQLAVAQRRAKEAGLESRVTFELKDYRSLQGSFNRIVSVGMFEHVGVPHYVEFFDKVRGLLSHDGAALIHSIGRMTGPSFTSAFIQKYIFPGGYIPAISEVTPAIEQAGLWLTDLEVLRLHYAETLRAWRERFLASADRLPAQFDGRFRRMWEFYLAVSEMSFRYGEMMVFQAQLAPSVASLPITRDYMFEQEGTNATPTEVPIYKAL